MGSQDRERTRAIRRRMAITGERFAAAARALDAPEPWAIPSGPPPGLTPAQEADWWECERAWEEADRPARQERAAAMRAAATQPVTYPPRNPCGPDDRCVDGACESYERVMRRANPFRFFDFADSSSVTCYSCGQTVCIGCQRRPVAVVFDFCSAECADVE